MVIKKIIKHAVKKALKSKKKGGKVRLPPKPKSVKMRKAQVSLADRKRAAAMVHVRQLESQGRIAEANKARAWIQQGDAFRRGSGTKKDFNAWAKRAKTLGPSREKLQPKERVLHDAKLHRRPEGLERPSWGGISPKWRKGYTEKGKRSAAAGTVKPKERKWSPYNRHVPGSVIRHDEEVAFWTKSGKKFGKIKPKSSAVILDKHSAIILDKQGFSQDGVKYGLTQSELDRIYPNSRWATKNRQSFTRRTGSNILNFFADTTKTRTDKALWGTVGGLTATLPPLIGHVVDLKNKSGSKKKKIPKGQRDLMEEQRAYEHSLGVHSAYGDLGPPKQRKESTRTSSP